MNHKNEPSTDCVSKKQEKSWTAPLVKSLEKDSDADIERKEHPSPTQKLLRWRWQETPTSSWNEVGGGS
jgi:hypothetical protein